MRYRKPKTPMCCRCIEYPGEASVLATGVIHNWGCRIARHPFRGWVCEQHLEFLKDECERVKILDTVLLREWREGDDLVRQVAGSFAGFAELLAAKGGYRPTLHTSVDPRKARLADLYDKYQEAQGDPRRAFRY